MMVLEVYYLIPTVRMLMRISISSLYKLKRSPKKLTATRSGSFGGLLFLILIYLLCMLLPGFAVAQDSTDHLKCTGLIGELSYYKQSAETHALRIFNHKALPDSVKSIMVSKYNIVRVCYDQMLLQLISDLMVKKRMGTFKHLDKFFRKGKRKKHGRSADYIRNWDRIMVAYNDMISYPGNTYLDSMNEVFIKAHQEDLQVTEKKVSPQQEAPIKLDITDPIGSLGSLFRIYRKIMLDTEQKASNLVELLNILRMRHPSELMEREEPKPEEAEPPPENPATR